MTEHGNNNVITSALGLRRSKDRLSIRTVRLRYLKYMLIFPLAPVFANMQEALFGDTMHLLELDAMTLAGSAYCAGAGLLFAFTQPKTIDKLSRALAVATAGAFLLWLMLPRGQAGLIAAMLFTAGLGGCAACASCAYIFVLNEAERFLGAAAISLFFAFNQLEFGLSLISGLFPKAYLAALVTGTCMCLLLYEADDFSAVEAEPETTFGPALALALYFFVAHYLVEVFYTYLPGTSLPEAAIANGATGIAVVFLAFALRFIAKHSVWNMCNLFFVAITASYALYFAPEGSVLRCIGRFVHGFEQMGYIAAYYLLGCVFKEHGDFRLFKLFLVVTLPASMIVYVIPGVISAYTPEYVPLVATTVAGTLLAVFILMSSAYSTYLFFADRSDDPRGADTAAAGSEEGAPLDVPPPSLKTEGRSALENCGLSPREIEVSTLLLQGESAKHVAKLLKISTSTVNYHIKNLYRKLGIGSRAELFARFGSLDPSPADAGKDGQGQ